MRFVTDDSDKQSKSARIVMVRNHAVRTIGYHSLTIHRDPAFRKSGSVHYFGPGGRASVQIGAGKASKCGAILTARPVKRDGSG